MDAIVNVQQIVVCNEWYYWTHDGAQGTKDCPPHTTLHCSPMCLTFAVVLLLYLSLLLYLLWLLSSLNFCLSLLLYLFLLLLFLLLLSFRTFYTCTNERVARTWLFGRCTSSEEGSGGGRGRFEGRRLSTVVQLHRVGFLKTLQLVSVHIEHVIKYKYKKYI